MDTKEISKAFDAFLSILKEREQDFLKNRNLKDDIDIAAAYKHLLDLVSTGIDFYADTDYSIPRLVQIVTPYRKIGGDNAHALYHYAPVFGGRKYKISGHRGETCYIGFTVYGGKSEEEVGIVANKSLGDFSVNADGTFEVILGSEENTDSNYIKLTPETNSIFIRQYFYDMKNEKPATLSIEAIDNPAKPLPLSCDELASKIRSINSMLKVWTKIAPMPWPADPNAYNKVCPPFQASASTGHWSTPDNIHSFGFFKLEEDDALVLRGKSPDCIYWSCHFWNGCMQTFDYMNYSCAINNKETKLNPDGSWDLVIARKNPGVPNWLDTAGHSRGFIYFRWLKAAEVPGAISSTVIKIKDLKK
jgi:hypothetical protein